MWVDRTRYTECRWIKYGAGLNVNARFSVGWIKCGWIELWCRIECGCWIKCGWTESGCWIGCILLCCSRTCKQFCVHSIFQRMHCWWSCSLHNDNVFIHSDHKTKNYWKITGTCVIAAFSPKTLITFNPFTAPACKISRLKDAQTRLQTVYFPVL